MKSIDFYSIWAKPSPIFNPLDISFSKKGFILEYTDALLFLLFLSSSRPHGFSLHLLFGVDLICSCNVSHHFQADDSQVTVLISWYLPFQCLCPFWLICPECFLHFPLYLPVQTVLSLHSTLSNFTILKKLSWRSKSSLLPDSFLVHYNSHGPSSSWTLEHISCSYRDWPWSVPGSRIQWLNMIFWEGTWCGVR